MLAPSPSCSTVMGFQTSYSILVHVHLLLLYFWKLARNSAISHAFSSGKNIIFRVHTLRAFIWVVTIVFVWQIRILKSNACLLMKGLHLGTVCNFWCFCLVEWLLFILFLCSIKCQQKAVKHAYHTVCSNCAQVAGVCEKCGVKQEIVVK